MILNFPLPRIRCTRSSSFRSSHAVFARSPQGYRLFHMACQVSFLCKLHRVIVLIDGIQARGDAQLIR
jgi:hypothetical protein